MTTQNIIESAYSSTPTASFISRWDVNLNHSANNYLPGYATTVTSASPVTLTVGSAYNQYFTGSTAQTVTMPVASTLVLGQAWFFVNLSSATLTIQSSGSNTIVSVGANQSTIVTCILTSGTSAASWSAEQPVAGEGIVNSGTINDLAWYAATGSAVSALATANNGVLVTSAGGVPSISSTTPAGLTLPQPLIQGVTNASSATAGNVGEILNVNVAATGVSFTSTVAKDITTLSLTAGDWLVFGNAYCTTGGAVSAFQCWVNTSSATKPDNSKTAQAFVSGGFACPVLHVNVSGSQTVYLSGIATFSSSTASGSGSITALRIR